LQEVIAPLLLLLSPCLSSVCPTFDWCLNNAHPGDPCCADPCNLASQYNPSVNEHNYVLEMSKAFASV